MTEAEKLEALRLEFVSSENIDMEAFTRKIDQEIASKNEVERKQFIDAFNVESKAAVERAEKIGRYVDIKVKLADILDIVSMSYIAEKYFKKSRSWFSQRLNNHKRNGIPVSFTDEELDILSNALDDIGQKLRNVARSIA
ncbi:DUF5053 domain-containing protein [Parabacteroides sp. Marseille-P3160]|uniref:DUF5053 domain-containing protein n=1 Tax=Parabacteroides sp. Marseille-P3160 TaxID=1917887 RepID=UPI0009B98CED|nr:DUF5053 domain-containing protein [Parabacteroides sp. Marseille-P3160]